MCVEGEAEAGERGQLNLRCVAPQSGRMRADGAHAASAGAPARMLARAARRLRRGRGQSSARSAQRACACACEGALTREVERGRALGHDQGRALGRARLRHGQPDGGEGALAAAGRARAAHVVDAELDEAADDDLAQELAAREAVRLVALLVVARDARRRKPRERELQLAHGRARPRRARDDDRVAAQHAAHRREARRQVRGGGCGEREGSRRRRGEEGE